MLEPPIPPHTHLPLYVHLANYTAQRERERSTQAAALLTTENRGRNNREK